MRGVSVRVCEGGCGGIRNDTMCMYKCMYVLDYTVMCSYWLSILTIVQS